MSSPKKFKKIKSSKKMRTEESNNIFWGSSFESGKTYSQVARHRFRITMAALEPEQHNPALNNTYVSLMMERNGCEYLLCSLQHGRILQVNLNLIFEEGENVTFSLRGKGTVHVSGFLENKGLDKSLTNNSERENYKITFPEEDSEEEDMKATITSPSKTSTLKKRQEIITIEEKESDTEEVPPMSTKNKALKKMQSNKLTKKQQKCPVDEMNVVESSENDESDSETKVANQLTASKELEALRAAKKRLHDAAAKSSDEDSSDVDSDDDEEDDEEEEDSDNDEDEEMEEQQEDLPPRKRLKAPTSTPKPSAEAKTESKQKMSPIKKSPNKPDNINMNSSIGRTPMPKKTISHIAQSTEKKHPNSNVMTNTPDKKKPEGDKPFAKKLPNGLEFEDMKVGIGPVAKRGKLVSVYYIGKFADGSLFDSKKPPSKPFSFKLGFGQVIPGWEIGIEGMKVGGKRKFKVPPKLGYGNKAVDGIPANSTLYFVVELVSVQ